MIKNKVITVFTFRSTEHILEMGGTQAWTCRQEVAASCEYVVVSRNTKGVPATKDHDAIPAEGHEPHGTAFMIGKVSDVVLSDEQPSDPKKPPRYMIKMSEWAPLDIPNVWQGWRRPFKYMTLDDLGIDPTKLEWELVELPASGDAVSPAFVTDKAGSAKAATAAPIVPPAVRSIEMMVAELKHAIAVKHRTTPDKVDVKVSVQTTAELAF